MKKKRIGGKTAVSVTTLYFIWWYYPLHTSKGAPARVSGLVLFGVRIAMTGYGQVGHLAAQIGALFDR